MFSMDMASLIDVGEAWSRGIVRVALIPVEFAEVVGGGGLRMSAEGLLS